MPISHDLLARLVNASRARLGQVALPATNRSIDLAKILYNHGFISAMREGTYDSDEPLNQDLFNQVLVSPAEKRLWIDLKYENGRPGISSAELVSRASRRVTMKANELILLNRGTSSRFMRALEPGEIAVISTSEGLLDLYEAIRRHLGGEILCRIK